MIRRLPLLVLAIVAAVWGVPAAAHEGPGTIEVLAAEPTAADARTYRVRVVFVADGHVAPEATVTATIVDQPGAVPVSFAPTGEEGVYEGTVRFPGPGEWTVRLTSLRPIASTQRTDTVAAPVAEDTTTTTGGMTTTGATAPSNGDGEPSDGGTSSAAIAGLIATVAVVIAVAGAVTAARRRRATGG